LPNGDIPFGYMAAPSPKSPPVLLEAEAVLVGELYERYASGQHSFSALADWINGCGVSPRSKRGKTSFTGDSIRDIVSNSFYRGVVKYRGEEKPGRHEPIVSDELWFLCERTRASRRKKSSSVKPTKAKIYMLQGILSCAKCDSQLWNQSSRTGPRYQDNARHRKRICPNRRASVKCQLIDQQIDEFFSTMVPPANWVSSADSMVGQEPVSLDVARERRSLLERRSRLKELYLEGDVGRSRYETERAELTAKLESLDLHSAKVLEAASCRLAGFRDSWKGATPDRPAELCCPNR
jgi:site-specific DNA recombinase